jgi:hypothetical protein
VKALKDQIKKSTQRCRASVFDSYRGNMGSSDFNLIQVDLEKNEKTKMNNTLWKGEKKNGCCTS